jgi:hypothetical protein
MKRRDFITLVGGGSRWSKAALLTHLRHRRANFAVTHNAALW